MTVLFRACLLSALTLIVAACGDNAAQYMLEEPATQQRVRVRVATIEVREVTLPAYAAASEIMLQAEDGALRSVPEAIWADNPVRAVTLALARNLDAVSTATAAAEPWPLEQPADVRVDVRIDRMVARADGQFQLAGQFAVAAPEGAVRETINRFDILHPLSADTPRAVAQATGAALQSLSQQIVARLR